MLICNGDLVRFNNPDTGIPLSAVWRAVHPEPFSDLKLYPYNDEADAVYHRVVGLRFKPEDFEKVVPVRDGRGQALLDGDWVAANDEAVRKFLSQPTAPSVPATDVGKAEAQLAAAANAAKDYQHLLQNARDLESSRRQALRLAKAAKAEADKEAAARAKVEEARKDLSARLDADRCLAQATLALIHEVTWLNNGGAERPAAAGIANHADQLQPLARSYGYRIVKPSTVALVVKL